MLGHHLRAAMEIGGELEVHLEGMREYYRDGNTREASWRKSQLRGLRRLLEEREAEMYAALEYDLGKHPAEAYRDEVASGIQNFCFFSGKSQRHAWNETYC